MPARLPEGFAATSFFLHYFFNRAYNIPPFSRLPVYVGSAVFFYCFGMAMEHYRTKFRRDKLLALEEYKKIHPEFFPPKDKCMRLRLSYLFLLLLLLLFLTAAFSVRRTFSDLLKSLSSVPLGLQVAVIIGLVVFLAFPLACGYMGVMVTSGYLFGSLHGAALISGSALCALVLATAILRHCFRDKARRHLAANRPTLEAVVAALERPKMLNRLILLIRMAPIPFGLQNLIFSLSEIGRCKYAALSWLGLLPNQLLHAAVGASLRALEHRQGESKAPALRYSVFAIQIVTTLSIITIIFRIARKELNRIVRQESPGYDQV